MNSFFSSGSLRVDIFYPSFILLAHEFISIEKGTKNMGKISMNEWDKNCQGFCDAY